MEIGFALVWLGAYAAVAALAYPITAVLFARFPGKGAGFALPLGLATLAMTSYYVGRFAFGYESLVAGLLLLGLASALALRRGVDLDRRAYAEAMAVFGVAFFLFVVLRALDPAVHPGGGEKFLDFGLLNSLWRAETVPPEDMWFAGEPMAYYYGGHMVAALLAKATFTPPKYAYNLALPGFYALLVTGVYTLAGAIADERGASRFSAAALAAVFVGLASNLATPLRLLAWLGSGIVPGLESFVRSLGVEVAGLAGGPERFSYWTASRVIDGTANEFPFFAYLNGDMHAHMMSKGFLLLVAGLLWQAVAVGAAPSPEPAPVDPADHSWKLFAPTLPATDGWFVGTGTLASGATVDLYPHANISRDRPPDTVATYPSTRWRKYLATVRGDERARRAFADYLCRRGTARRDAAVETVDLDYVRVSVRPDDPATERLDLGRYRCGSD